jgi:diguanylate cyclase (GGDEF)-like protein
MKNLEQIYAMDRSLKEALSDLKKADKTAAKKIAKHLFTDTLCPWVGNRAAYNDFLSRHKYHGFHVSVDLNSFSEINNRYGHLVGDDAIKIFFKISSEISRMLKGKNFRVGGDENRLFFNDKATAEKYSQELKARLSKEKVRDFQLSASVGIGYTPEHAEAALKKAKEQLGTEVQYEKVRNFRSGEEPTVIVTLLNESPPASWSPVVEKVSNDDKKGMLKIDNPLT